MLFYGLKSGGGGGGSSGGDGGCCSMSAEVDLGLLILCQFSSSEILHPT